MAKAPFGSFWQVLQRGPGDQTYRPEIQKQTLLFANFATCILLYPCDRQIQEDYDSAFVSDWCGWHGSSTYGRPSDLYSLIGI